MIQVICFSRARPLQLHGYLTSVLEQWDGDVRVSVLEKVDDAYFDAYTTLQFEFAQVDFCPESEFCADLSALIDPEAAYTCFGCDDVVYVAPVVVEDVEQVMAAGDVVGLSLRLGSNITQDMFGRPLGQPEGWKRAGTDCQFWDVTHTPSVGDWAYPWEVLGTVYPTTFVRSVVEAIVPPSPSQLEARGSVSWDRHTQNTVMASYPTSRLVVPTVNLVQHEYPNGIRGQHPLSPEFLLECWNQGLRMDTQRYAGMTPETWRIGDFYLKRCAA